MDRLEECRCCREIQEVLKVCEEAVDEREIGEVPECITRHPGFKAACLNKWVLKIAWYQYKQQYGGKGYDGPEHKKLRHVAYRQLVRWCWGVIGKEIRVSLPACAVCCIRAHFPPPGLEENFEFVGFRFSDE